MAPVIAIKPVPIATLIASGEGHLRHRKHPACEARQETQQQFLAEADLMPDKIDPVPIFNLRLTGALVVAAFFSLPAANFVHVAAICHAVPGVKA